MSQTIRDAEIVLGIYDLLDELGYVVFCDWVEAPTADRSAVTPANADAIRRVMSLSDTLLYLDTENADASLWMCWELGWFDGAKGHVAIIPVVADDQDWYRNREFLGLYPFVRLNEEGQLEIVRPPASDGRGLTMFEAPNSRTYYQWLDGDAGFMRPRVLSTVT